MKLLHYSRIRATKKCQKRTCGAGETLRWPEGGNIRGETLEAAPGAPCCALERKNLIDQAAQMMMMMMLTGELNI